MKRMFTLAALTAFFLTGTTLRADEPTGKERAVELIHLSDHHGKELWIELNEKFASRPNQGGAGKITLRQVAAPYQRNLDDLLAKKVEADIIALGIGSDLTSLQKASLLPDGWDLKAPHRSVVYGTPIVFLVPKGNPRNIKDWADLARAETQLISLDPKIFRVAQYGFLGAWGSVIQRGGSEAEARALVTKLFKNAKFEETTDEAGARKGSPIPREENQVVLLWENEALNAVKTAGNQLEIVYPPISIRGESRIAILPELAQRRGTQAAAEAYLKFLYSDDAQRIIARHNYRPVRSALQNNLPTIEFFTVRDLFQDSAPWQQRIFGRGGLFEEIRSASR